MVVVAGTVVDVESSPRTIKGEQVVVEDVYVLSGRDVVRTSGPPSGLQRGGVVALAVRAKHFAWGIAWDRLQVLPAEVVKVLSNGKGEG